MAAKDKTIRSDAVLDLVGTTVKVNGSEASGSDPTALSDAAAARMGMKSYTQADETITEDVDSGTVAFARLIPRQDSAGNWWLKFQIADDPTGTGTNITLTFSNTTFATIAGGGGAGQALSAHGDSSAVYCIRAKAQSSASIINLDFSSVVGRWACSGEVLLASKPSWVD